MANSYKRYIADLPAATSTVVLVVPDASTMIVRSIWISNNSGALSTVKVSMSPLGSGTHYLAFSHDIAAGEYYDVIGTKATGPLILEGLDRLRVESSGAYVSVTVSALLVDRT